MAQNWSLGDCLSAPECVFCCFALTGGIFYKCQLGQVGLSCSGLLYPQKIFCLPVLSVLERRVLKYPNTVCLFSSVLSVFEVTNLEYKHVNLFCLHDESIPLKL